jgi:hypothetical protein
MCLNWITQFQLVWNPALWPGPTGQPLRSIPRRSPPDTTRLHLSHELPATGPPPLRLAMRRTTGALNPPSSSPATRWASPHSFFPISRSTKSLSHRALTELPHSIVAIPARPSRIHRCLILRELRYGVVLPPKWSRWPTCSHGRPHHLPSPLHGPHQCQPPPATLHPLQHHHEVRPCAALPYGPRADVDNRVIGLSPVAPHRPTAAAIVKPPRWDSLPSASSIESPTLRSWYRAPPRPGRTVDSLATSGRRHVQGLPYSSAMGHQPERLGHAHRPTRPFGHQCELGRWVIGPVALGRRPAQHRFNLFLFRISLNNSINSIKFIKYIENKIKLIKIQNKFL